MTPTETELKALQQRLFDEEQYYQLACQRHLATGPTLAEIRRLTPLVAACKRRRQSEIVANVLIPRNIVWHRAFDRERAEHLCDLFVEHGIHAAIDYDEHYGHETRTAYVRPPTNEACYAAALHELGHGVEDDCGQFPYSVMRQGRTVVIISPFGECRAWRFAVNHCYRGIWTMACHDDLQTSLNTYRDDCETADERDAIQETIAWSFSRVQPRPDTFEGRAARVRQIEREETMRRVERDIRYHDVMRRYASR